MKIVIDLRSSTVLFKYVNNGTELWPALNPLTQGSNCIQTRGPDLASTQNSQFLFDNTMIY